MSFSSDTVYRVLLLVLVLRTSLGMFKYVYLLSILRVFVPQVWVILVFLFFPLCFRLVSFPSFNRVLRYLSTYLNVWLFGMLKGSLGQWSRIFSHQKPCKTEIAFSQEIHLTTKGHHRLKASWTGQTFYSIFRSRSVIIHKNNTA